LVRPTGAEYQTLTVRDLSKPLCSARVEFYGAQAALLNASPERLAEGVRLKNTEHVGNRLRILVRTVIRQHNVFALEAF
jgi:hypothetical protein